VTLSERDRLLLEIVRDGGGELSSRQIDIRFSHRMPQTKETVFEALDRLAEAGLLVRYTEKGSPRDRYDLTDLGRAALA
jgi:DNA-binding PadR family transcriptional regulator